jgi:beta-phosphoglucomutase
MRPRHGSAALPPFVEVGGYVNSPGMTYGVIFDMDGVLVDSYQAHFESWRQMAAEYGLSMTEPQFRATFGRTSRDIIRNLWGEGAIPADQADAADDRKELYYRRIVEKAFPAMPGASELLSQLAQAGFKMAIGSSGPPANVSLAIDRLGKGLFGAVVTGREVTRGKPDPQVFVLAADKLGVSPRCCAVVEDAPAGVEAALRAGMYAIALTGTAARDKLSHAHWVVDSLSQITPHEVLARIKARAH